MPRLARTASALAASLALIVVISACGTQRITLAKGDPDYHGAVLFSQRCSGCHTLSAAATRGSASNVRTREIVNGPNFNVRCERPVDRVLYAIENGGFSGAIMPQNIVVGQDAHDVAMFVARYAGGAAASSHPGKATYNLKGVAGSAGSSQCSQQPVGTLPPIAGSGSGTAGSTGSGTSSPGGTSGSATPAAAATP